MLLYHLFYVKQGGGYSYLLAFRGVPLISRFSEICYPVPLYIMLSGYGLYASYSASQKINWWRKAKYIYFHLWIIYLIFLPIACFVMPDKYPGDIWTFIQNVFSIRCSYNAEQWFLLPYLIILALARPLFSLVEKLRVVIVLFFALGVELVYLYLYKSLGLSVLHDKLGVAFQLYLTLGFLFPIILGVLCWKCNWQRLLPPPYIKCQHFNVWVAYIILISMIVFRMFVPNQSLQILAVFVLLIVYPALKLGKHACLCLQFLGKHSMNIWLIHTWICYYLFKDIIYGFKWPVLIFTCTLLLSILASIVVESIYKVIIRIKI